MVTVGGQSRPGGAVLVTPSGQAVGSADVAGEKQRISRRRRSSSKRRAAQAKARAEQLKRIQEEQKRKEQELRKQESEIEQKRVEQTAQLAQIIRDRTNRAELERVRMTRKRILNLGGRTRTQNLKNERGQNIRITTTEVSKIQDGKKIKERVLKKQNLETGETTIRRFGLDKGKTKQTGKVEIIDQDLANGTKNGRVLTEKEKSNLIKNTNLTGEQLNQGRVIVINNTKFFKTPKFEFKLDIQSKTIKIKQNIIKKIVSSTNKLRTSINKKIKSLPKTKTKKIKIKQIKLNKDIDSYNNKYNNKELSKLEFNKAKIESELLNKRQTQIESETDKLEKSIPKKIKKLLFNGVVTTEQTPSTRRILQENIDNLNKKIAQKQKQGKGTKLLRLRLKNTKKELDRGSIKLIATEVPIGVAAGVSIGRAASKMQFIGKQKTLGNQIITDVVFSQGGKRLGVAKGVTVLRGKKGFTVVAGRSGVPGVEFPSAKPVIKRVESFVSKEVSLSKPAKFKVKTQLNLLNKNKKIGKITLIKDNLRGLNQFGIGQVASIRGQKFIKVIKGKKQFSPGINRDTFASFSSVITKKDLSLIIGRTITSSKNKVEFIGLIKGEKVASGLGEISSGLTSQYQQALSKVIGTAAASLKQANKIKGLSKSGVIALASTSTMIKNVIKAPTTTLKPRQSMLTKQEAIVKQREGVLIKQAPIVKQRLKNRIKTTSRQISQLKTRVSTKTKTRQTQIVQTQLKQQIKQATAQLIKLSNIQKLLQKQVTAKNITTAQSLISKKIFIPVIFKLKSKRRKRTKTKIKKKRYTIQVKKDNKWIDVSKENTKIKAESKAFSTLKNTLRASFRILKNGKVITIKLRPGFRRSKTNRNVIVQKKTKIKGVGSRIGSIGEKLELLKSKRNKRRKKKKIKKRRKKRK